MLWLALGVVGVVLAIAASGTRRAAAPRRASIRAQNRPAAAAGTWPAPGSFPIRWTPPRVHLYTGSIYGYLPGVMATQEQRENTLARRLGDGDPVLAPRPGGQLPATWEREHRITAGLLALLFLELADAATEARKAKLADLAFAFGATEAALLAADGEDPNAAVFAKIRADDEYMRRRATGIMNRAVSSYGGSLVTGETMAEVLAFFYDAFANRIDWSFKSHGAGPRLELAGLPWTPAQAEQLAEDAYIDATSLHGAG